MDSKKVIPPTEDISVESDMRFRRLMEDLYPNCPHLHPDKNQDRLNPFHNNDRPS